jgi:hypothetical protein
VIPVLAKDPASRPPLSAPNEAIWAGKAPQKPTCGTKIGRGPKQNGSSLSVGPLGMLSAGSPATAPVRLSCRFRSKRGLAVPALLNQSTCSMPLSTEIGAGGFHIRHDGCSGR